MSRVYWHSRERDAELHGSERAWLSHIAQGPATAAWDLDAVTDRLDQAIKIASMIPEVEPGEFGANYLHEHMRKAIEQDRLNKEYYAWHYGTASKKPEQRPAIWAPDFQPGRKFIESLKMRLGSIVSDTNFLINGHKINAWVTGLNTAIVMGSRPVQLATRIYAQCELHCWIESRDRVWLDEIIGEGLAIGIYRQGAWADVRRLLLEGDDGPVVLAYSVTDSFPNRYINEETATRIAEEDWYELPGEERWDIALADLRRCRPWARIGPDTLDSCFEQGLTVYDLLAPDRDERVAEAFARQRAGED